MATRGAGETLNLPMITSFKKIKHTMLKQKRFGKYLLYALGEILLIVIGILIALQINNQNELNNARVKELVYLRNIQLDLARSIESLETMITTREDAIKSAEILIEYYDGTRQVNLNDFNLHNVTVAIWYPFEPHNNTYQELINSGNLALISDIRIRHLLQDMQTGLSAVAFIENEMQQDYESYLYDVLFAVTDIDSALKNYQMQMENPGKTPEITISGEDVERLLQSQKYKNGIVLSAYNSGLLSVEYTNMVQNSRLLTTLINQELVR